MSSTLGNTDTATTTVTVSGTTAASSLAKTTGAVVGQTITVANGSVASSFVSDSAYNTKLVVGGTEQKVASYKFTATNDSFTVTDIAVNFAGANAASAINYVVLKNSSGTVLNVGGTPLNGTEATSSGLAIAVPANGDASVDVYVNLNTVGAGAATTTADVKATLDTFKYQASTGVQGTDANDRNANDIYVVRTLPTIANVSLPSTTLAAGTQTISRVKISADAAAPISWKKLTFTVAKQNATLGSTSTMQLTDSANNVIAGTFATTSGDATITFVATTEQSIGSSETYNLKVSVGGIIAGYNYITTNIAAPSSTVATPNTYATIAGGTGSFIWSDKSALSHSESTADWLNDFKVLGLPTDSQTMAVSI
jgi:hypothetical protein